MFMPKKKNNKQSKNITNRRVRFDYELSDSLVVGIELTGAETKALRLGQASLQGAYVTVKDNQLWLLNAIITGDKRIRISESDQTRTRRLLARRREINQLIEQKQQGKTIVPLEILTSGHYVKLRIAAGRGKRKYDKRQTLKKRDQDRYMKSAIKSRSN